MSEVFKIMETPLYSDKKPQKLIILSKYTLKLVYDS